MKRTLTPAEIQRIQSMPMAKKLSQKMWPAGSHFARMPYPVALEASGWSQAFDEYLSRVPPVEEALGAAIENPLTSVVTTIPRSFHDLMSQSTLSMQVASALGLSDKLEADTAKYAMHRAFRVRKGALIEETPALHDMLAHADIAADLPSRFFKTPFPACYVHFGRPLLISAEDRVGSARIVGAYVLSHEGKAHLGPDGNPHEGQVLDFITAKRWGINEGDQYKKLEFLVVFEETLDAGSIDQAFLGTDFVIGMTDDDASLIEVIRRRRKPDADQDWAAEALLFTVNHLAKVFLYMGLASIRRVEINDRTAALRQLEVLGAKKRAKAERHIFEKYDRIVIGPEEPFALGPDGNGDSRFVSPHLRRGHFRMQRHGPANQLQKLVFIAPVLVRADLAANTAIQPKKYLVA
ncbi:MAG: hypothetical protein IT506_11060 [Aquabacterium sp.]|nr:hypothetical protein [Aquabacterium sp.]